VSSNPPLPAGPRDGCRERVEAFALGALAPDEVAALRAHASGCGFCRAELAELRDLAADLAGATEPVEPPAGLWTRLRARLERPGFRLERGRAAVWLPTGVDGVDARVLSLDPAADRQTILLRFAPGAAYPVHRHHGPEECYVLAGDVADGPLEMTAGDFVRFEQGTEHGPITTRDGCLLMIVSSLHDEAPHA
jgi:anti-sigma factor ChrR (cupin superfamily)